MASRAEDSSDRIDKGTARSSGSSVLVDGSCNDQPQTITVIIVITRESSVFKLFAC